MMEKVHPKKQSAIGQLLLNNSGAKIAEILILLVSITIFIQFIVPLAGDDPLTKQGTIWFANVLLLLYVWLGLKLRGQSWADIGLAIPPLTWKKALRRM